VQMGEGKARHVVCMSFKCGVVCDDELVAQVMKVGCSDDGAPVVALGWVWAAAEDGRARHSQVINEGLWVHLYFCGSLEPKP
jgi:ariadne-1